MFHFCPAGEAPADRLVFVGRATTAVLTVLTFFWLPVLQSKEHGLYIVIQSSMNHLAPPVAAMFILGLFWRRANGEGALAGLASGTLLGLIRLLITLIRNDKCDDLVDDDNRQVPKWQHISILLCCPN